MASEYLRTASEKCPSLAALLPWAASWRLRAMSASETAVCTPTHDEGEHYLSLLNLVENLLICTHLLNTTGGMGFGSHARRHLG